MIAASDLLLCAVILGSSLCLVRLLRSGLPLLLEQKGEELRILELEFDDDYTIVSQYQTEYRGIVQYYLLAQNVCWLSKLHWVMQTSLLKTLAHKYKASVRAMARKYKATRETPEGTLKCLRVTVERGGDKPPLVAYFGGIPLRRRRMAILKDLNPLKTRRSERNELIRRLLADECELCGSRQNVEVHHIRKLADLESKGQANKPEWARVMSARRRKTLVVCQSCHNDVHYGRYDGPAFTK